MQSSMNEDAVGSAYANYLRVGDFDSAMSLCRALRLTGHAAEAQDLCERWVDKVDGTTECAQLAIDMCYLGMFAECERLLGGVADAFPFGTSRHLVMSEFAIAKYHLGKYHEAHEIFRSLRDKGESANLVRLLFTNASASVWDFLQDKFLGLSDSIEGMRIGILQEGGVGDLVMYSRYVDMLLQEGASSVSIQTPQTLRGCIKEDHRIKVMGDANVEIHNCDYVTTMFSLFARYQLSPYFPHAPSSVIALPTHHALPDSLMKCMDDGTSRRKIGIVWRSASGARHEPYRSIDLCKLATLLENRSCRFFSLQVGGLTEVEKALFAQHGIVDLSPYLSSFADAAAIAQKLDLLISVDTGPAHLASTFNCPVWLLLSQACDSRWLDCQRFTPWYTSMRLFRQPKLGDWTLPLHDMNIALVSSLERA